MADGDRKDGSVRRTRRRVAPGSAARKGSGSESEEPNPKVMAQELVAKGMPFQMAMAVARGRITMSEALERMARDVQVEQLMERHDLSRALATQIALGHASLDKVLAKRRMAEHRENFRDRSVLVEAASSGEAYMIGLFGGRRVEAVVKSVDAYTIHVVEGDGEPEELHKLSAKYAYLPSDWKRVRKGMKNDKALAASPGAPAKHPQDRYTCSDKRMFRYLDGKEEVSATLLEGEIFRGTISWFGRYEFGLDVKGAQLVVFRHALHDLRSV